MSNHPKQTIMWSWYTFLQDISIEFLGYSHHEHFGREKWDKERRKVESSATSCCTIRAMSCTSSSCEEIGSVQLLPHTGCIEEDLDRAHPFSEIIDCAWNYLGYLALLADPKKIKTFVGNKQHTLIYKEEEEEELRSNIIMVILISMLFIFLFMSSKFLFD